MDHEDCDLDLPPISLPVDYLHHKENIMDDLPHSVNTQTLMQSHEEVLLLPPTKVGHSKWSPPNTSTPIVNRSMTYLHAQQPSLTNDSGFMDSSSIYTCAGSFLTTCSSVGSSTSLQSTNHTSPIEVPRDAYNCDSSLPLSDLAYEFNSKLSPTLFELVDSIDGNVDSDMLHDDHDMLLSNFDDPVGQTVPSLEQLDSSVYPKDQILSSINDERDSAFEDGSHTCASQESFSHNASSPMEISLSTDSFVPSDHGIDQSLFASTFEISSNTASEGNSPVLNDAFDLDGSSGSNDTATPAMQIYRRTPLQSSTPLRDMAPTGLVLPLNLPILEEERCNLNTISTIASPLTVFKNDVLNSIVMKHSPREPDRLIGRKMGVGKYDIIAQIGQQCLDNFLLIMDYLNPVDIASACCVSKRWNKLVTSNEQLTAKKMKYIKSCQELLLVKENLGKTNSDVERIFVTPREPLVPVTLSFRSKRVVNSQPSFPNFQQFWELGATLVNEETLVKCPQCSHASKVNPSLERGRCSNHQCQNDFCTKCSTAFHGSNPCPGSSKEKIKNSTVVASKKSKKNLKRL